MNGRHVRRSRTAMLSFSVLVMGWAGCGVEDAPRFSTSGTLATADEAHEVEIAQPPGLGLLNVNPEGASPSTPTGIACATCHGDASQPALARREGHPVNLHRDLVLRHGELACTSCHDPDHPDRLVLAGGGRIPIRGYMRLCAQCHGPQSRDYAHGSHGGMKGHWNLRVGPRQRNGCLGCHGAHAPAYPRVRPAPPPNDRFLQPKHEPGAAYEQRWSEDAP